jgi:hypothetical protein
VDAAVDDLTTLHKQLKGMPPRAALPAFSQASMILAATQQLVCVDASIARPRQ